MPSQSPQQRSPGLGQASTLLSVWNFKWDFKAPVLLVQLLQPVFTDEACCGKAVAAVLLNHCSDDSLDVALARAGLPALSKQVRERVQTAAGVLSVSPKTKSRAHTALSICWLLSSLLNHELCGF